MELIKLTSLFSDTRFPMFIRGNPDFDQLLQFVKSYFESLEGEGKASHEITYARENSDIDTTTEKFLDRFYSILCPDLPKNIRANKRLLLKHAKELYFRKGTPESFHLLFKILYNDTISLKYPGEYILRASDGIWNQPIAMHVTFLETLTNDQILSLVNKEIVCINDTGVVRNTVVQIKKLNGPNLYEIILDKQQNTRFFIGNNFDVNGFRGTIAPTIQSIEIIKGGRKFKLGQVIDLNFGTSKGSTMKITRIDSNGGIVKAKIIRFGTGYDSDIALTIVPATRVSDETVLPDASLPLEDKINEFQEEGYIEKQGKLGPLYDYFLQDYVVETDYYTTAIVAYFGSSGNIDDEDNDPNLTSDDYAFVKLKVGAVINYPGYWSNNQGNLSDPLICLQDNSFYQNFSYVIQSSIARKEYESVVTKLIHPAGMRMFSDLLIENIFDVSVDLSDQTGSNYRLYLNDLVDFPDEKSYHFYAPKDDSYSFSDNTKYHLEAFKEDDYTLDDDLRKAVNLNKDDSITLVDGIGTVQEKLINDTITLTENISKSIAHPVDDSFTIFEDGIINNYVVKVDDTFDLDESEGDDSYVDDMYVANNYVYSNDGLIKDVTSTKQDATSIEDVQGFIHAREFSDTFSVSDNIKTSINKTLADSIAVEDTPTQLSNTISVDDNIVLSDSTKFNALLNKNDTLELVENIASSMDKVLNTTIYIDDTDKYVVDGYTTEIYSQLVHVSINAS